MFLSLAYTLGLYFVASSYNIDSGHPIIYKFPMRNRRPSYFGMSVSIRPEASTVKDSWVIQIGAPRSNISGVAVKEPGAIFRCRLFGPCETFVVDNKGNAPGINHHFRYKDRKDESWTGVSMDMKMEFSKVKTVVCGSRWSNQNLTNDDNIRVTYLMTGVCYLQDICNCSTEHPTYKLLPLVNPDKIYYPKPYAFDKSFYYWGLGQAGMSSALLDDLSAVIMGAPGYNNWLGTVIQYDTDVRRFDFKVGLFENTKEFKRNSYPYIGYQVSFGRFFSDRKLWLAASAPRSENYHGKVLIFQFKESSSQIHVASEVVGSTFGEYFGSSLAVLDVNNDGFDDLIVGAPLFFRKYPEEGRVYVYLGTNRGYFLFRSQVINGRTGYSRFGHCLGSLDDLDQDSFRDVAVGAPYENDGRGAVYIFRGSKRGLEMEYSQRILAQEVFHGLRGFGASLSGGIDIDGNKYSDLAVGSYLSDEVVVLRSRPIVYLHPAIRLEDILLLERKAEAFNISVCSRYTGSNAPNLIRIVRTVEVDANRNRAFLTKSNTALEKNEISLFLNEMICEVLSITRVANSSNFEPIQILLKSELPPCRSDVTRAIYTWGRNLELDDKFEKFCPIGRKRETYIEIPFAGECGTDNICQAELDLTCDILDIPKNTSLIVTSDFVKLSMDLRNTGEPAHNTEIVVYSNMDLISNEFAVALGEQASRRIFRIDVGSTFVKTFHASFSFRIATDSLDLNETTEWGKTHLKIRVEAQTRSAEDFVGDNVCDINFNLLSDAVVDLYSSSATATSFDLKNTTEQNFTFYYEVQKKGGTPVSDAELNIYLPSYFEKRSGEVEFTKIQVETSPWIYYSVNNEAGLSCILAWLTLRLYYSFLLTVFTPRTKRFANVTAAGILGGFNTETGAWVPYVFRVVKSCGPRYHMSLTCLLYGLPETSWLTNVLTELLRPTPPKTEYKKWDGPSEVDVVWQNISSSNASLPEARTVFLNCTVSYIRCKTVTIVFPDGIPSQISSQIKIFITLNVKGIESLMNEKDIIHFTSAGVLEFTKLFEIEPVKIYSQSSVTFYKEEEEKAVEPYVIALSAVAGGLLLSLIISAMAKSEFFRRKKKEELKALKTQELQRQSNYEFPPEIIGQGDDEECK